VAIIVWVVIVRVTPLTRFVNRDRVQDEEVLPIGPVVPAGSAVAAVVRPREELAQSSDAGNERKGKSEVDQADSAKETSTAERRRPELEKVPNECCNSRNPDNLQSA